MPANLGNSAVAQDWERTVFIPIPKKGNVKECSNYCTIALISHTSRAMVKILQSRFQQYINLELPDVQSGFRKGRGTRYQIVNIRWILKKQVQFTSGTQSCQTLCDLTKHSTPGLPVHHQLTEFTQIMSIESMMLSNHLTFCRPLLLLPSIFSSIRVFSNESALCIRWPKC